MVDIVRINTIEESRVSAVGVPKVIDNAVAKGSLDIAKLRASTIPVPAVVFRSHPGGSRPTQSMRALIIRAIRLDAR